MPVTGHELTICDYGQMYATRSSVEPSCSQLVLQGAVDLAIPEIFCDFTADKPGQSDQSQHCGLRALGTPNSQGDGPHASRSTPESHRPSPPSANGDVTSPSAINPADMEQAIISSFETRTQDGKPTLPAAATADRTANISGEGVDGSDDLNLQYDRIASLVEGDSDENRSRAQANAIGTSATQSPLAQREMGQVASFGLLVNASMGSCPSGSHDLDMEADEVDVQGGFSISMDEDESDEDETEPRFVGVFSDTTFDPSLRHRPQPYSHSFNIQHGDFVDEENGLADLAMEDAGAEAWEVPASLTATNSLQPFSLLPSVSSAVSLDFPGVPPNQTAGLVNGSMHESPMLGDPHTIDMTIPEGVRLQHATPPQNIAWPFLPNGTHPMPLVEVEMFKEPDSFIPRLSPIPASNIFTSLSTSHSTFRPTSPSLSIADPVPAVPSGCRPIEGHKAVFESLDREVDSNPAVAAGFQHKSPPIR